MHAIVHYPVLLTVYYIGLTLTLFAGSTVMPVLGFFARLLSSYASLIVSAIAGVLISITLRPLGLGHSSQHYTARTFAFVMRWTTGVSFEILDPENYLGTTRPAVFISNHQTELDVLMLGAVFPRHCSVTAKKSLRKVPFLGWFMALSDSVFIDRANAVDAKSAMSGAAREMRERKQSVFMFPEGTRSYAKEPKLLPFKKGAFNLAVDAQVPVVPIVVACYEDVLYVQGWRFRGGRILVKGTLIISPARLSFIQQLIPLVLKPIQTTNLKYDNVTDLARDTRELMLTELIDLTVKQRRRPTAPSSHASVTKPLGQVA